MHELLKNNNDVFHLYADYVKATVKNYPTAYLFPFCEIYNNVTEGLKQYSEPTDKDIVSNVKSVLEAMAYTSSNQMADMFERAEKHTEENYHSYSTEQKRLITLMKTVDNIQKENYE